jgi:alpha-ketoglutarate-dependent taurine dioxygenase
MSEILEPQQVVGRPSGAALAAYQQWRGGDLVMWDNRCVLHRRDELVPPSAG